MWIAFIIACTGVPPEADTAHTPDPDEVFDGVPQVPGPSSMARFSWVEDGLLSGMPVPRGDDLHRLGAVGVAQLVTLTEHPIAAEALAEAGLEGHHLPIEDYQAPTRQQLEQFIQIVEQAREDERPVTVHCLAGIGRTGTMLTAWFIHEGMSYPEALAHVRGMRPGSVESQAQHDVLIEFAERY